jgi:hypothetical protein
LLGGSELQDFVMEVSRFLPLTDATLIDRHAILPRTYFVNRAKIGFMSAVGDGLTEF